MPFTPAQRRALNWAALTIGLGAFFWLLAPVLTPFVIGAVLAYALHPAVEKLAARRVPRLLAVTIVEIAALVAAAALVLLVVPIISKELPLLRDQVPVLADRLNDAVSPWLKKMGFNVGLDPESLKAVVLKYLDARWDDSLAAALASARIGGSILVSVVGYGVLVPVVLFYLLIDWPLYVRRVVELVPPRMRGGVAEFASECDTCSGSTCVASSSSC